LDKKEVSAQNCSNCNYVQQKVKTCCMDTIAVQVQKTILVLTETCFLMAKIQPKKQHRYLKFSKNLHYMLNRGFR